jgi:GntR family transcriptional regulator
MTKSRGPGTLRKSPQYYRIYQKIRRQIQDREYPVGTYLPTESELGIMWGVSRTTVRRAIELLTNDGFVYARPGCGTEVIDFEATQKLQYITSFSETLVEQGFEVGYRNVSLQTLPAPAHVASDLNVDEGSSVIRVHRTALANGKPIAIMVNYLVPSLFPGIEDKAANIRSLYAFLESEYNVIIEAATDFISAISASKAEAEELSIEEGDALLLVRRITFSKGNRIEWADLRIVAGHYVYSVRTKMRPDHINDV